MKKIDFSYMQAAIHSAQKGMKKGAGGPFGACIVKGSRIVAVAHNQVLKRKDSTCHAEINAIRIACRKAKTFDLSGHDIYSTTEPCPMCFAAIHWARIDKVLYGTAIPDVARRGFHELSISSAAMKKMGKSRVRIVSGFSRQPCLDLLKEWDHLPIRKTY